MVNIHQTRQVGNIALQITRFGLGSALLGNLYRGISDLCRRNIEAISDLGAK